jgi:hypothetical protein
LAENLALILVEHPELEQIVLAWPDLPENIKPIGSSEVKLGHLGGVRCSQMTSVGLIWPRVCSEQLRRMV